MSADSMGQQMESGDIVVIGNEPEGQRRAIELGAGVLVVSNSARPEDGVLRLAEEKGTTVVLSPLDSYVTSRMIQLSVPCWEVMSEDPLTVDLEALVTDIAQQVMEVHYRAAIAVDENKAPIGMVTRTDLINPIPRRVLLVDHAERGQSVPGVEEAQVVEILDYHHVGNIETRVPIPATFDPVGSTATLVVERYKANGIRLEESTAKMLLAAVLSDTVIFNSPTTTERDHEVVRYLEELLGLDAREFGMEMFEASSDVSGLSAGEIVDRDLKEYALGDGSAMSISQIETVGTGLLERKDELLDALEEVRRENGYLFAALMVTDIISQGTELLCVGDCAPIERAFDQQARNHVIDLPGVMSRKKRVAPSCSRPLGGVSGEDPGRQSRRRDDTGRGRRRRRRAERPGRPRAPRRCSGRRRPGLGDLRPHEAEGLRRGRHRVEGAPPAWEHSPGGACRSSRRAEQRRGRLRVLYPASLARRSRSAR